MPPMPHAHAMKKTRPHKNQNNVSSCLVSNAVQQKAHHWVPTVCNAKPMKLGITKATCELWGHKPTAQKSKKCIFMTIFKPNCFGNHTHLAINWEKNIKPINILIYHSYDIP